MKVIFSFFLRAKHWQIFVLFVGYEVVSNLITLPAFAGADSAQGFGRLMLINGIVTVPFLLFLLAWFWSMGSFLNSIVKPSLKLNADFFGFSLLYPPLYVLVFFLTIMKASPSPFVALILPFHLFAMFCLLYNLYFISKNLVQAETGKSVSFYDYAGPFFLIWFFPIGVWFTQPRINRLFAKSQDIAVAQEPVTG